MSETKRASLGVVFLTMFIDLVGFSILFPLFGELMAYYRADTGVIGTVLGTLNQWFPDASAGQEAALFGGILIGLYALLQFVCAPLWGGLSDRIGRKPVLLITIGGNLLGYLLWIWADSFALLLVSRAICGVMAGNISVATAAVADVTDSTNRTKGMAFIGMAFGLGFILGPAIGGMSYHFLPRPEGGLTGFGLNPFSGPAIVAAVLAAVNLVWVGTRFGETRQPGETAPVRLANPLKIFAGSNAELVKVNSGNFLFTTLFACMEATLVFLAMDALNYTPGSMALVFVVLGFTSAGVQGGLVRRIAPKYGPRKLALAGLMVMVPAFIVLGSVAYVQASWLLYIGVVLLALGTGLVMPSMSGLVSLAASEAEQGRALGAFRGAGALGRAVGPFLGAGCYFAFGPAVPYWVAAAGMVLPLLLIASVSRHEEAIDAQE